MNKPLFECTLDCKTTALFLDERSELEMSLVYKCQTEHEKSVLQIVNVRKYHTMVAAATGTYFFGIYWDY